MYGRWTNQWEDAKVRVKGARALHQHAVGLGRHTDPSLNQDIYYIMDGCKRSLKKLDWD